jgi:hypothetical protein
MVTSRWLPLRTKNISEKVCRKDKKKQSHYRPGQAAPCPTPPGQAAPCPTPPGQAAPCPTPRRSPYICSLFPFQMFLSRPTSQQTAPEDPSRRFRLHPRATNPEELLLSRDSGQHHSDRHCPGNLRHRFDDYEAPRLELLFSEEKSWNVLASKRTEPRRTGVGWQGPWAHLEYVRQQESALS